MRRFLIALTLGSALSLVMAAVVAASTLTDGAAALERGDWATAHQLLRPLADQGDARAQSYLGALYAAQGAGPPDQAMAILWLSKAADQGDASAQVMLGRLYEGAFGHTPDLALAAQWFRKAASQAQGAGVADAQLELARLYLAGAGVPRDKALAQQWFVKAIAGFQSAADGGDLRVQMTLAGMYDRGEGTPRDHDRAQGLYGQVTAIYRARGERGDPGGQFNLGQIYARGLGLKPDKAQAALWYRRAADQGDLRAQMALGELYASPGFWSYSGAGLTPGDAADQVQAYVWLRLGSTNRPALLPADINQRLRETLTPAQRDEADRTILAWRAVREIPPGDGGPIRMTPAQQAEADRLQRKWTPTPPQIAEAERTAESYDMALGAANAPVTLIEYMSPSSAHSARFHNETLPALKARYVDTGKLRIVFREFITPPVDFAMAGSLLAHCAGPQRNIEVLDAIFHQQDALYDSTDWAGGLRKIAHGAGLSDAQYDTCIADKAARQSLVDRVNTFGRYERISGVPTFVLGVDRIEGDQSTDQLERAIQRALGLPVGPDPAAVRAAAAAARFPPGLFFRLVDRPAGADSKEAPPTPGDERLPQIDGDDLWLLAKGGFGPASIEEAQAATNSMDQTMIRYRMDEETGRRFADFTAANVGRQFAMILNGVVISAPVINMAITGDEGEITGHFSAESAEQLARTLKRPVSSPPVASPR